MQEMGYLTQLCVSPSNQSSSISKHVLQLCGKLNALCLPCVSFASQLSVASFSELKSFPSEWPENNFRTFSGGRTL